MYKRLKENCDNIYRENLNDRKGSNGVTAKSANTKELCQTVDKSVCEDQTVDARGGLGSRRSGYTTNSGRLPTFGGNSTHKLARLTSNGSRRS